jgi:nucleoside-diphosphate-sugar epimerase
LKVLLTGASGFVGSHVLESLGHRGISSVILLRQSSDRSFLGPPNSLVEARYGSISDPASLSSAMDGVTHVVHCAGATKARKVQGFYEANQIGTRNVIEAANSLKGMRRVVHLSSLAAAGPGTAEKPVRESDPTHPVSHYGRSKLAGEDEVRQRCRSEFVIIRPPGVYGPRDRGFLPLFAAVKKHVRPCPSAAQQLSLVYVKDLAETIVAVLTHSAAASRTYFAAGAEVVSSRELAAMIATELKTWTIPLPLPTLAFWPVCLLKSIQTAITGVPDILSLEKFPELRAPGWVCDPRLLTSELGLRCATPLRAGLRETIAWYEQHRWI